MHLATRKPIIADMQRWGRCRNSRLEASHSQTLPIADISTAKLQLTFHFGVHFHLHGHLGIRADACPMIQLNPLLEVQTNQICSSLSAGLLNGGFGGLFRVLAGTAICYRTIDASLAEMESMAPTSGGKFRASPQKSINFR